MSDRYGRRRIRLIGLIGISATMLTFAFIENLPAVYAERFLSGMIGDSGNDIAMFERSGLSIAMGNASPEVRRAADFVTDSNREEGFANAIERFILGGDRSNAQVGIARAGVRAW